MMDLGTTVFILRPRSRVALILCCIFVMLIAASWLSLSTGELFQWDAGLYAEIAKVDLGIVLAGDSRDFQFKISNDSDRPVKFLGSRMSCTCTAIEAIPKTLPGRGTLLLCARFSPSTNQLDRYIGTITIFTDNPKNYELRLQFEALVTDPQKSSASNFSQHTTI